MLCCVGLTVEAWFALVLANQGTDVIDLFTEVPELKMVPEDLEVPVLEALKSPKAAVHRRLLAALDAAAAAKATPEAAAVNSTINDGASRPNLFRKLTYSTSLRGTTLAVKPNPFAGDPARAATTIQAAWRGWRDRRMVADLKIEECSFLGMPLSLALTQQAQQGKEAAPNPEIAVLEESAATRQAQLRREYEAAKVEIEALLKAQEGPFMALEERSMVHSWLEERLDKVTGQWPEIPLTGPLPGPESEKAGAQQQESIKSKTANSKREPQPVKPRQRAASIAAAPSSAASHSIPDPSTIPVPSFTIEMEELIKSWKEVWDQKESGEPGQKQSPSISLAGLQDDDAATSALSNLPLPRRGSSVDAINLDLLAKSLRPQVRESVRQAVREQAKLAASSANASLPSTKAGQGPSADKKKAGNSAKQKQGPPPTPRGGAKQSGPGGDKKKGSGEQQAVKKKEPQPPLDLDLIFKDLFGNGIARQCPSVRLSDFLGEGCYVRKAADGDSGRPALVKKVKSGGKAANAAAKNSDPLVAYPELSFEQINQLLMVQCVLPLMAPSLHGRLTARPLTALIYGPSSSGKTMLAEAVIREPGAMLFDLSPSTWAGKFPGKAADGEVETVFAAAKAAAPSIILIDEVEKVFIRDSKRAIGRAGPDGEPPSRIRQQLLAEVAALRPSDGVLVLCTSSQPHACVGVDQEEFIAFFQMLVEVPLPRDRTRRRLLAAFASEQGVEWVTGKPKGRTAWQELSIAARMTDGFTSGQLKKMVDVAAETWKVDKKDFLGRLIEAAAAEIPPSAAELTALTEWTAQAHAVKKSGTESKPSFEKKGATAEKTGKRA